ncbi:MAG: hypothetical protein R2764_02005 [Bacteroidales bacterium]
MAENDKHGWIIVADINNGKCRKFPIYKIFHQHYKNHEVLIQDDIIRGTSNLKKMVAFADGFQITNTDLCYTRHYTNTF